MIIIWHRQAYTLLGAGTRGVLVWDALPAGGGAPPEPPAVLEWLIRNRRRGRR
jgi:hypothetical protein